MERNMQDAYLLTDMAVLGAVGPEASTVTTEQSEEPVQTVYATQHIPSVLEENGYRHIYVTIDNPADITSLTRTINQPNIVTVAVPTSQLINNAGTFIIQPPDIAGSTETTSQTTEQELVYTEALTLSAPNILPENPESQQLISTSVPTEQVSVEAGHTDASGKEHCFFSVTASLPKVNNSQTPCLARKTSHIPLVLCRCDVRKNDVKTQEPIFTSVQASLASQLLKTIPGCTSAFLHDFATQHNLKLQEELAKPGNLQVSGDLHKLLCLHDNLSQLISAKIQPAHEASVDDSPSEKDKPSLFDLIQPQYSRSGRLIKRKNLDHPMDKDIDLGVNNESYVSVAPIIIPMQQPSAKRKRGRPPKVTKVIQLLDNKAEVKDSNLQFAEVAGIMTSATIVDQNISPFRDREENGELLLAVPPPEQIVSVTDHLMPFHTEANTLTMGDTELALTEQVCVEHISAVDETKLTDGSVVKEDSDDNDTTELSEKENAHDQDGQRLIRSTTSNTGRKVQKPFKLQHGLVLGRTRHKKDYESLAPYKFHCSTCSFRTKRKSHYLKHINIHTKKSLPVLQCAQCRFTTIRLSHLRRHQLSHSDEVFTCKVCSYHTDDMKRLNRHHRIKHTAPSPVSQINVVYQCDTCEYKTLKSHQYSRHLRCHAGLLSGRSGQPCPSYQCPLCSYKTQHKEHCARHVANVHSDRRPYLCDLCGKAFKRQDALRQHKVIHQDKLSRPLRYSCQECLKGFRSHAHLMEHRTIHTDIRSYLCEICGAAFKTRSVQRKHVQTIHQNPRAHSCPSCDKRFNTKYALQRHLRTHNTPGMRSLVADIKEQFGDAAAVAAATTTTTVAVVPIDAEESVIQELPVGEVMAEEMEVVTVEGGADVEAHLPQTTYIQTNEETTALLYLTSLPPY